MNKEYRCLLIVNQKEGGGSRYLHLKKYSCCVERLQVKTIHNSVGFNYNKNQKIKRKHKPTQNRAQQHYAVFLTGGCRVIVFKQNWLGFFQVEEKFYHIKQC